MENIYSGKRILVTGGTGMIGIQLVPMLLARGARVRIVSLDDTHPFFGECEFLKLNLMAYDNCLKACEGIDYVFHLAGIKVSAGITQTRPASIFVPGILFNTNMMEAARVSGVKKYLYTSTVGVYQPAERFYEDDMWKGFPSSNDWFGGWAKRMGELQAEAYGIEYGWKDIAIVRPTNIYGPGDNFDPESAMVIPSIIRRIADGEDPLNVWGDGSEIRDFAHSRDVAYGMLLALQHADGRPINIGSGTGVTIRELVETIMEAFDTPPHIQWDIAKRKGDSVRVMDISRARSIGYEPQVSLKEGIQETVQWYLANRQQSDKKYNVFRDMKTSGARYV